jgi:LITAF-like zinc ribbon domain
MGLFGSKKTSADPNGDGLYVDMEQQKIPIAVAVSAPPSPGAVAVFHQKQTSKQQQQQQKQQAIVVYNTKNGKPPPVIFVTRTPTVIPLCPVCSKRNVRTRIRTAPDWLTWVTVAVLLVVFWPLFWIPLVTDACRRTTHYCTACGAEIGSIRPFKDCFVKHR